MLASSLRRGLVAGLLGGLVAGLFAFIVGEQPLERAVRLEEAATPSAVGHVDGLRSGDGLSPPTVAGRSSHVDRSGEDEGVVVSRRTQRLGLLAATGLVGVALGGMFGIVFTAFRRRLTNPSSWMASLQLGVVAWLAVALLPSLKYPANPPGVGAPATGGARSGWYLAAIVLSLVTALATWAVARRLRARGVPVVKRHVLAAAVAAAGAALVAALPPNTDPVNVPAALLWNFRLSAFGTAAVLWLGLAVAFGLLGERAGRPSGARQDRRGTT
ncbi:MAG: CbtA family protein [Actinomycetota bacterium]|nr:CbtA family protein [Actinomycetota bacterium]